MINNYFSDIGRKLMEAGYRNSKNRAVTVAREKINRSLLEEPPVMLIKIPLAPSMEALLSLFMNLMRLQTPSGIRHMKRLESFSVPSLFLNSMMRQPFNMRRFQP
jgi:hypothetical protein